MGRELRWNYGDSLLVSANVAIFEEAVKWQFRGYRKELG